MNLRPTIVAKFQEVASSQHRELAPITDDLDLVDSGLDSLCFAIIVAALEDELGFDPFSSSDEVHFPITFGDFLSLYENAGE